MEEAAEILGLAPGTVKNMCASGKLEAKKIGKTWVLHKNNLEVRKMVKNLNGVEIDFAQAVEHMDDEIRENLHDEMAPCTDQEFFTAYENAHKEKFNEVWFLSEENPVW
ncbi:helix-turn-helix domain-containing protein [Robertmurraya andreesenii]|uniref:Excisionase family DNA binding protein n=1 Tax=Anoxybacillus andreesenii TaxID=1325932 RepID=A0ABT9V1U6_9BACL|nr:helix-turn-helix domain-containing protein [Robertmurraya andreesenii]MDQ0154928.1 excisionase family DNA binding protein [Robertmurraya andreesenii]